MSLKRSKTTSSTQVTLRIAKTNHLTIINTWDSSRMVDKEWAVRQINSKIPMCGTRLLLLRNNTLPRRRNLTNGELVRITLQDAQLSHLQGFRIPLKLEVEALVLPQRIRDLAQQPAGNLIQVAATINHGCSRKRKRKKLPLS